MHYVIWGENEAGIQREIGKRAAAFQAQHEGVIEHLDGEIIEPDTIDDLASQSLFQSERLIIIRDISKNKKVVQRLTEVHSYIPDTTTVIFREQKLRKNDSFLSTMKEFCEVIECKKMITSELINNAVNFAHEQGLNLSKNDAQLLVQRVGDDELTIQSELQKLSFIGPEISRQDITALVEQKPEDNIFDLLDFLAKGDAAAARRMYRELRAARQEPLYIVGMIAWHLKNLAHVVAREGQTAQEIAKEAAMSPFVVRKMMQLATRVSRAALKDMVHAATDVDHRLKSSAANDDQLMEYLLLRLTLAVK